jgi:antitoxin CptB
MCGINLMATTRSSAELDPRRRKILFRCWHRGTKEMDLVFGRFADSEIDGLDNDDLDAFEVLMEFPDRDLFSWISGEIPPPVDVQTKIYSKIVSFTNSLIQ